MPKPPRTFILDDLPTETDTLDFQPYVDTLVDIAQSGSTPLTIGVFGTWGSGKTSLMKMVKKGLPKDFTIAWFDAWKYDKEETLWRAFLLSILSALHLSKKLSDDELGKLTAMLYRALDLEKSGGVTIDLAKLGAKVAQGAVQIGLSFIPGGAALGKLVEELQKSGAQNLSETAFDAIQRERTKIHIEQVRFLEQFQQQFSRLVQDRIVAEGGRLVVFVDDLDRCLPEKAIEVLEAIKLFVDAPGCVFLLGLDQGVIARGIEIKYRELKQDGGEGKAPRCVIDGARYLEKIIQLPFQIPPVERTDMGEFVAGLTAEWPHPECPNVFAEGLGDNPRQIKRTVNVFLMLWKLAEKREKKLQGRIKPIRLAKVVAIQTIYPELYTLLKETPRYLRELEEYYRSESRLGGETAEDDPSAGSGQTLPPRRGAEKGAAPPTAKAEPPPALAAYISRQAVRRILTMHPPDLPEANFSGLPPDELRLYFTLTRRAEAPQAASAEAPRQAFEPQMVRIPAGKFLMGTTPEQAAQVLAEAPEGSKKDWQEWLTWEQPQHEVELSEYFIGKYPVTNREYQFFVKETGYRPPEGWDDGQYPPEKGDHPVVNVSWNDAQEYCRWLREKTGKPYRLPTEAEWEKAARGTDGRIYPWGDDFDPQKCNMAETGLGGTSPVGQFSPQGDSPYGCADMAGNVWEWCLDGFDEQAYKKRAGGVKDPLGPEEAGARVLRGGSFLNDRQIVRCAARGRNLPYNFGGDGGFRVVVFPINTSAL
ncbi:MAG: SUMF1/EgtB/PvdO family nonheme iron enzyme [Anaerolineales bacterium]